jgi:thioredoxin
MKKITAILTTLVLLAGCGNSGQQEHRSEQQAQNTFIKHVGATEFQKLLDAGNGIILDVRTPQEVAQGYIINASTINIYAEDFEEKINLIPKEKEIYVYCKGGGRSADAAQILQKNGFNKIYNLRNGILEWEEKGFPIVKSEIEKDDKIQEMNLTDFKVLLNTHKPVLIDFHTVWCAPCRKMAPLIDKIEEEYHDQAVVMRIDVDKSKEVGSAYNIKGVPVFILFKNGEEKWKYNGIVSEEELKKQIENNL